jgi:hypothetical protein
MGCGSGGLAPVDGQVVWKDGSHAKELSGSLVTFQCDAKRSSATGVIQPDGSFKMMTLKPGDGAAIGEHTVLVMEVGRVPQGGPDGTNLAPSKIDSKYSTPGTSGLTASIKPGQNKITLTVDRNPGR